MATVSEQYGVWRGVDGQPATVTRDYDDQTLVMTGFHCNNQSASPLQVTVTHLATGRTRSILCPANTVTNLSLPTQANQRLTHNRNAAGKLDGIEWSVLIPAP